MMLQEKALKLLQYYPLCDYCLGRQFSNLATGTTNLSRGKTIKDFLVMDVSTTLVDDQIQILQCLSRSGSDLAKKYLVKKEIQAEETMKCYICEDSLEMVEELADLIIPHTEGYEFYTILIGTLIPKSILERETELKKQHDVTQTELLKQEFNRNVGKKLSEKLPITTDFKSPEIVIEIDPFTQNINMRIKSLYIYGKYRKFLRTIPQTRWPCRRCKGKGCDECNNTGKKHLESVEELIEVKAIELAKAEKITLHGGGREDIDALMLGTGRPFVFEIVNPRIRSLSLRDLEKKINDFTQNKVEVLELRWSTHKEVVHVKQSAERAVKKYRALVSFLEPITDENMVKIEKEFHNKELQQRTPNRVSHRRADKIREKKVYSIECTRKDTMEIEMLVRCDGGCYVKELISGDEGRTKPSISEITMNSAVCKELDVIEIMEIPYIQEE
ncbi:MAG: tRNA pseudouridine(54/55) synthase Pus10 [Candidatus Heimdallarchaeota archaeon]|nr:tRNA pseudouridine(54/55) synthase Pus10 [Candidatus Heimdallarchaeota archaeon]